MNFIHQNERVPPELTFWSVDHTARPVIQTSFCVCVSENLGGAQP